MPLVRTAKIEDVEVPGEDSAQLAHKLASAPMKRAASTSNVQRPPALEFQPTAVIGQLTVAVVGDPAVGKTALLQTLQSRGSRFPKQYLMTCGVELFAKSVAPPAAATSSDGGGGGGGSVDLHLLDCGGQDLFAELLPRHWQESRVSAVLLVYDATREHTFDAVGEWYRRICESLGKRSLPGARWTIGTVAGSGYGLRMACGVTRRHRM